MVAIPLPISESELEIETPYLIANSFTIVLEYLKGQTRTKTKMGGQKVSNTFEYPYGRIEGTTDSHGEELDIFLVSIDADHLDVYVIDQICPDTRLFDEHKIILGATTQEEAVAAYRACYGDAVRVNRIGAVTTFSQEDFRIWIDAKSVTYFPASHYTGPKGPSVEVTKFFTDRSKLPQITPSGAFEIKLPDISKGPLIKTSAIEGGIKYTADLYSEFSILEWTNAIDDLVLAMHDATEFDEFHIRLISRGGAVHLMGRLISAMDTTKAHVVTYADGCVASAATGTWVAGHERHICEGAYFMQHMSSQGASGKTTSILRRAGFTKKYVDRILDRLVEHGPFNEKEVDDMRNSECDKFLSGRTAIERIGAVSYTRERRV